jgi:hypothetical protein
MQAALSMKCCLGSRAKSVYATLMEDAMVHACKINSNAFWSVYQNKYISFRHVVNCLWIRTGTLWTAKFAKKLKLPYYGRDTSDGKCPRCGYHDDSPGHILAAPEPTLTRRFRERWSVALHVCFCYACTCCSIPSGYNTWIRASVGRALQAARDILAGR